MSLLGLVWGLGLRLGCAKVLYNLGCGSTSLSCLRGQDVSDCLLLLFVSPSPLLSLFLSPSPHPSLLFPSSLQCRNMVERISKNHIVNNLVAAYLRANPGGKREMGRRGEGEERGGEEWGRERGGRVGGRCMYLRANPVTLPSAYSAISLFSRQEERGGRLEGAGCKEQDHQGHG